MLIQKDLKKMANTYCIFLKRAHKKYPFLNAYLQNAKQDKKELSRIRTRFMFRLSKSYKALNLLSTFRKSFVNYFYFVSVSVYYIHFSDDIKLASRFAVKII